MTVRINKQKINLREKLAGVDEHINAEQSLAALNNTTKDINVTNLYTNNEHIRNSGSFANNPFVPFGPHARMLDLANTSVDGGPINTSLKGFSGGFTDGRYGYFVPNNNGVPHGKVARVDLNDFNNTSGNSVGILDLTQAPINGGPIDTSLKGFQSGFTDGRYGYFVPYDNGVSHGKVARVDLSDFSSVSVLDLKGTDADLKGFIGGFTDGRYGYFVPYHNGVRHGKVARVDLSDFSSVSVLDLEDPDGDGTKENADLKGFQGGFTDGRYGYFVPYNNGAFHGKIARVDLNDLSSVSVLDLTQTDEDLKGFKGGFTDGRYGYFVPHNNGLSYSGKVARIQLFNGGNL